MHSWRGCHFSATNNTSLHEFGRCAIFVFVGEIRGNKNFAILIRLATRNPAKQRLCTRRIDRGESVIFLAVFGASHGRTAIIRG